MGKEPLRMLIVEDDDDYRMVLRKELGRLHEGVALETCFLDRVADAQRVVDATRVDVILSDFELPDGTGADVMQHAHRAAPASRRVFLTGSPEKALEAVRSGAATHAIWDKSIGLHELRARLVSLVGGKGAPAST